MASVERYTKASGAPGWMVRWRGPDGRPRAKRFDREHKARAFRTKVEADLADHTYVDPAGPRMLFADMGLRWAATAPHLDTTARTRDRHLRLYIYPALGHLRLGDITALELQALLRDLEGRLAPRTVRSVWRWVPAILNAAVDTGRLPRSPVGTGRNAVRPRPAPRADIDPLEGHQVEALLAELPDHYRVPAMVAADAGLRLGEVFGLTQARVAFLRREPVIGVRRQLITTAGAAPYLRGPKYESVRDIPVPASLTEALAAHMARFGSASVPDLVTGRQAELVFATLAGGPVSSRRIDDSFKRAARRAGLPPGTHFHDLRHHYASVLIDAGLSEREIGRRLGHSSAQVTALYGNLLDRAADRTRAAVEAAVARREAR